MGFLDVTLDVLDDASVINGLNNLRRYQSKGCQ